MEYEYFLWLVDFIDPDRIVEKGYKNRVLYYLFKKDFTWTFDFPEDEDRAKDGLFLRDLFVNEGLFGSVLESESWLKRKPCSCLEMLIALSRRIETEILAWPGESNIPRWFWMFIENLGLGERGSGWLDQKFVSFSVDGWLKRVPNSREILPVSCDTVNSKREAIWKNVGSFLIKNREKYGF